MNIPCFVITIVLFAAWVYVEVQYYHWNKIDHESEQMVQYLMKQVKENSRKFSPKTKIIS